MRSLVVHTCNASECDRTLVGLACLPFPKLYVIWSGWLALSKTILYFYFFNFSCLQKPKIFKQYKHYQCDLYSVIARWGICSVNLYTYPLQSFVSLSKQILVLNNDGFSGSHACFSQILWFVSNPCNKTHGTKGLLS